MPQVQQRTRPAPVLATGVHSPRVQLVLFSLLLVATPFVMLQNFLQDAIGRTSRAGFELAGIHVPFVPLAALAIAVAMLLALRARLKPMHFVAAGTALLLIALAQHITDFYFGHKFYDLQQNWHYLAYGLFAFMVDRDLRPRGWGSSRIMLLTFFGALIYSSFDEGFQLHMSNRVFDVSDIAKDVWGATIGLTMLHLGRSTPAELAAEFRSLHGPTWRGYLERPLALLILLAALAINWLFFASLHTDHSEAPLAPLFGLAGFAVAALVFRQTRTRRRRRLMLAAFLILAALQAGAYLRYRGRDLVHNRFGLTVYRGIPIPFFDVLFFPGGGFRLVDKKHFFNHRDRTFFLMQQADIVLVGSGASGRGGRGFPGDGPHRFVYNPFLGRLSQIIILPTPEACRTFNRLRQEGKSVLFILHNSC